MRTAISFALVFAASALAACSAQTGEDPQENMPDTGSAGSAGASSAGASSSSPGTDVGRGEVLFPLDSSQPANIPACGAVPELGAACDTYEAKCQVMEGTCGSIYTCYGAWTKVQNCASPVSACPIFPLESGLPCDQEGRSCQYVRTCGETDSACKSGVLSVTPLPLPECDSLCQSLCTRLAMCGVAWASTVCLSECRRAHTCAVDSKEDSVALCQARASAIAGLDCKSLCNDATTSAPRLGEDDCSSLQ